MHLMRTFAVGRCMLYALCGLYALSGGSLMLQCMDVCLLRILKHCVRTCVQAYGQRSQRQH